MAQCDGCDELENEVERLEAEAERLRAALGKVAIYITSDEMRETHHSKHSDQYVRDRVIKIARAALDDTDPEEELSESLADA